MRDGSILGLDIGGANLKAAHSSGAARTIAFPLWKQPERLTAALAGLCAGMPRYLRLAVTMTGELCDCFETKRAGVQAILRSVREIAKADPVDVWCLSGGFADIDDAVCNPLGAAAANWLALAHFVGGEFSRERALLIDAGSTTTDIVYLNRGMPEPRGRTDSERLVSGELVYTGMRRTPVCAVLGMDVAAELFATMQDAYLLAGMIPENPADCDTADGRPATVANAHARMARMQCVDSDSMPLDEARGLAQRALHVQCDAIAKAIGRVLTGRERIDRVVLSGSGEVLGRNVCARHLSGVAITSLAEVMGPSLSEAACAYAVARLAAREQERS